MSSDAIVRRMETLREMLAEGEISERAFSREYSALARELLGDQEYERLRALATPGAERR